MAGHCAHYLFSVLPRGAVCLAIFGRDGFAVRSAMQREPQRTSHMQLPEYTTTACSSTMLILGNRRVMH